MRQYGVIVLNTDANGLETAGCCTREGTRADITSPQITIGSLLSDLFQ